jgi:type II secretory pathway pseudopilin PulG
MALIALGLTLLASSDLPAQENKGDTEEQEQQNSEQILTVPTPLQVEIVVEDGEAEARQASEQRADGNLVAQQGMNEATQRMADLALWQTVLIAIGTTALLYTLWLTRQANRAAQAAVDVTRSIGEAQTRAYLSFDTVKPVYINPKGDVITSILFRPHIINTGQTPAHIRVTRSAVSIEPVRPTEIEIEANSTPHGTIRVGAQRTIFLQGGTLPWDAVKEAIEKGYYIILICGVEFEDVFYRSSEARRTEDFAVRIVFNKHLTDAEKPVDDQPSIEWHDMQLEVTMTSPTTAAENS